MIERIRIQNYRSLHDVDVRLGPLTVLIGRSGSGKSNFVRAVRLLRDVLAGNSYSTRHEQPDLRAANDQLLFEVDFRLPAVGFLQYLLTLSGGSPSTRVLLASEERLAVSGKTLFHHARYDWLVEPALGATNGPGLNGPLLSKLGGMREAVIAYIALARGVGVYDFTGSVLQTNDPLERTSYYRGSGDTGLAVADRLLNSLERYGDWSAVGKSIVAVNPWATSVELALPKRDELRVGLGASGRPAVRNVAEESEGFRRYLAHLLALYQTPPKQTMFFEHPETGIHPGALSALFDEFKGHVDENRGQVILTTHSPQFLDHFEPEQIRVVEMQGDQTRIGPLAAEQAAVIRDRLMTAGELLTVDPARTDSPTEPVGAAP